MESLASKAELFRRMHLGPRILVLPNAWDVVSARIFEEAGFAALGTTSAGIAATLGYPDGERVPREEMLTAVGRITRSVSVPVSADLEAGYGMSADDAAATARGALSAGAAGLNLEDAHSGSLLDVHHQANRIRAVRRVAAEAGVPLVINARTDVFLLQVGPPDSRFDEAVVRANAYRDAGADCLFIPAVREAGLIGRLVRAVRGPINILALPGVPHVNELEGLGVARVSTGSGPMRAALTRTRYLAEELKRDGSYGPFTEGVITHAEVNQLLEGRNLP